MWCYVIPWTSHMNANTFQNISCRHSRLPWWEFQGRPLYGNIVATVITLILSIRNKCIIQNFVASVRNRIVVLQRCIDAELDLHINPDCGSELHKWPQTHFPPWGSCSHNTTVSYFEKPLLGKQRDSSQHTAPYWSRLSFLILERNLFWSIAFITTTNGCVFLT